MDSPTLKQYAMNSGEGQHSYVKNSSYQRGVVDVAKSIIEEEIAKKLDKQVVSCMNSFCIADYGCSTGHNSFPVMKIITQAITKKISTEADSKNEFFVFFNDNVTNDFNTLFRSLSVLPEYNSYYNAVGLPGDFHNRLLPKSSLHFAYCAWSLHWLKEAPTTISNKGALLYSGNRKDQVYDAYLYQFSKDLGSFLDARAHELVNGGLMTLIIPTVPSFWDPQKEYTLTCDVNLVGSCIIDMAKKGIIDEAKVDAFNLPFYLATPEELKTIIDNNNNYSIERLEILNNPGMHTLPSVSARAAFFRAVMEKLIADQFGSEIIDELFDRYMKKLAASLILVNSDNNKTTITLIVLKRKVT
ncbi:hypothetical protein ACJIZ3_014070 [Penstemon smallii]|uniref:Uncharacterized protein n=1 Tax=Penstemon smallii TaxID=265156 RepID=A0ABD3RIG4_9LAMI